MYDKRRKLFQIQKTDETDILFKQIYE